MSIESKFHNGTVTIRDIKPEITSQGLARSNGYVLHTYKDVLKTMKTLKYIWGDYKLVLREFGEINNYAHRLANTKKELEAYMEEHYE